MKRMRINKPKIMVSYNGKYSNEFYEDDVTLMSLIDSINRNGILIKYDYIDIIRSAIDDLMSYSEFVTKEIIIGKRKKEKVIITIKNWVYTMV